MTKQTHLMLSLVMGLLVCLTSQAAFDHTHSKFDKLLKKYVKPDGATSLVDYNALRTNDSKTLAEYTTAISAVKKKEFDGWKEPRRLAFLINTYNAFTLKLIIDNYPVKSIKKIGGLFGPFKKDFIPLFGEEVDLETVEHTMIRKNFNEPGVHFAVNCASLGCPAISNEAFVEKKLQMQFKKGAELFMGDKKRNYYKKRKKELYVSPIFKWFDEDFEKASGSVKKYVVPLITKDAALQAVLLSKKVDLEWSFYSWKLNDTTKEKVRMKLKKTGK